MFQLAETLYDAGYEYMLMHDHGPNHPDDTGTTGSDGELLIHVNQAWAFQFGYINAVIQAVKRSRGEGWEEIRTKLDPAVKESRGWAVPKL